MHSIIYVFSYFLIPIVSIFVRKQTFCFMSASIHCLANKSIDGLILLENKLQQ